MSVLGKEKFITDDKGKRRAVILDIKLIRKFWRIWRTCDSWLRGRMKLRVPCKKWRSG